MTKQQQYGQLSRELKRELSYFELPLIKRDGSKLWGKIYSSVIKRKNKFIGIRSCIVDLTEQKAAEDKLKKSHDVLGAEVEKRTYEIRKAIDAANRANQLKSGFLANVSYELRNPMHQILSYSRNGVKKIERPRHKLLHYFTQTRKVAQI